MRKIILIAGVMVALAAGPAMAADFGVFGQYWSTKDADDALGIGGKLDFGLFELRAAYTPDVTADTEPERRDFEISAIPLEAGLAYNFMPDARFNPYLGAGVGYYLLDTDNFDVDDEVGFYGVLGGEFGNPDGISFMVEGMYRHIEATVEDDIEDDIDLDPVDFDLSGPVLNAGIVWRF